MTTTSEIETGLLEEIKTQCAEEIAMRREEFCTRLMIAGLGPDQVKLEENFGLDSQGLLIFTCVAVYRDSGEKVDLNNLKPQEEIDIWKNDDFLGWFNSQSDEIQAVVQRFPPNKLYKIPETEVPIQLRAYIESTPDKEFSFDVVVLEKDSFKTISGIGISQVTEHILP